MTETITSAQNPKIKQLLALQEKSRLRRETGLFVVEGRREVERCTAAGFVIDTIFLCPEIYYGGAGQADGFQGFAPRMGHGIGSCGMPHAGDCPKVFEVSKEIYDKVAYRGGTEGIIAEVHTRDLALDDITLDDKPLIIVMESVEKPGNLGAVLRSADAAGADAVIICDPLTDIYNPNLVRASTGAIFSVRTACCTSKEAIAWLKAKGIRILTAQLQDSSLYYDTDMTGGTAIVIGTEATGLTDIWRQAADAHIRIPMLGITDSLNASVSAAILLYEAVRQRHNG